MTRITPGSHDYHKRVVLVDCDGQMNLTRFYLPEFDPELNLNIANVLEGSSETVWSDNLMPISPGLDMLPAFTALYRLDVDSIKQVKVWCWRALKTPRFRYDVYSWDYGCEAEDLIGKAFTEGVKRSEAIRCIREALMVSPYVTSVGETSVEFEGDRLTVQCTVKTIYGEVSLHV